MTGSTSPLPSASAASGWARVLKTRILAPVRRGKRVVHFPHENGRLGNLLYDWMHAAIAQRAGVDYRVVATPAALPWAEELPGIFSDIVVGRSEVRLWDRRDTGYRQALGYHYSVAQLHDFCRTYIAGEPVRTALRPSVPDHVAEHGTVVVNVRRGDYYSVPALREQYGFDVVAYVREALIHQAERGRVDRVHFVSDDIDWCKRHLSEVAARYGNSSFAPHDRSPADDFACLVRANRLVLTNSTFSYWGGYVAQALGSSPVVVAPIFHNRHHNNGHSYHLHPGWITLAGYGEEPLPVHPRRFV